MRPIFTWRSERSSTVSQLNQGKFSQELGTEIKSTYQGLSHSATIQLGWPYPCIWCWVTSVTAIMQGNANVISVEPPLAPQKQMIKTTSQTRLMITTERQFFMKAKKNSQVSLIHWPTHMSNAKCHKHKHKYMQINEDFSKARVGTMI
jgi:hypothetical protein